MRQRQAFVTSLFGRIAVVCAVVALAACARGPAGGGPAPTADDASPRIDPVAPVTVALLAPTNAGGDRLRRAAQDLVAAAQLARAERAPDNMTLKVYDTKGTGPGAAAAASKAIADGAAIIVGPMLGAAAKAAGPVAAERGINLLAFSNDASAAGRNVWILGQTVDDELERLLGFAGAKGVDRVAVAYPTSRYGRFVANEAAPIGRSAGVSVGPFFGYERSVEGIAGAAGDGVRAIKSAGVNGVLIADRGDALRFVAKALSGNGVSSDTVQYMGLGTWEDAKNTSEPALSGGWYVGGDPSKTAVFNRRFSSRMGRQPHPVASIGYDAVAAASDMLKEAAAGGDPAFGRRAITRGRGFDGATGAFRLTDQGVNRRSLAIMRLTPTGARVLDPAPRGAPAS